MHPGFAEFAGLYLNRPLQSFLLIPSGVLDDLATLKHSPDPNIHAHAIVALLILDVLIKRDYEEAN